jgi:hypothetical protein
MPQTPHVEKHFTSTEAVRDIVIGMSDGLTVPFCQRRLQNGPNLRCGPPPRYTRLPKFFRHKCPQLQAKVICGEKML